MSLCVYGTCIFPQIFGPTYVYHDVRCHDPYHSSFAILAWLAGGSDTPIGIRACGYIGDFGVLLEPTSYFL